MRYEEPSSMVQWDSPLFTVPWDEDIPAEDIWQAITKGDLKPANAGTRAVSLHIPTLHLSPRVIDGSTGISCPRGCLTNAGKHDYHHCVNDYD